MLNNVFHFCARRSIVCSDFRATKLPAMNVDIFSRQWWSMAVDSICMYSRRTCANVSEESRVCYIVTLPGTCRARGDALDARVGVAFVNRIPQDGCSVCAIAFVSTDVYDWHVKWQ